MIYDTVEVTSKTTNSIDLFVLGLIVCPENYLYFALRCGKFDLCRSLLITICLKDVSSLRKRRMCLSEASDLLRPRGYI